MGRILQVVGWLWIVAGFLGPIFEFESVNPLLGLILVFIARIIRARARSEMPPLETQPEPQTESSDGARAERRQRTPPPPPARQEHPAPTAPQPETEPRQSAEERDDLLERIALAGREADEDIAEPDLGDLQTEGTETRTPMSSAEMIARARRRWDRSKR